MASNLFIYYLYILILFEKYIVIIYLIFEVNEIFI